MARIAAFVAAVPLLGGQQKRSLSCLSFSTRCFARTICMRSDSSSGNANQIYPRAGQPESIPPTIVTTPQRNVPTFDTLRASRALWSAGWLTWWIQLILSVIATTIFIFAFAFPGVSISSSANSLGLVLSAAGVVVSLVSVIWTYGYTRLSLWLRLNPSASEKGASKVKGRLRAGIRIGLLGIIVSIIGLQAVAGTLLARLFTSGFVSSVYAVPGNAVAPRAAPAVQPIDILVVQASANALSALLASVLGSLWLKGRLHKWTKKS